MCQVLVHVAFHSVAPMASSGHLCACVSPSNISAAVLSSLAIGFFFSNQTLNNPALQMAFPPNPPTGRKLSSPAPAEVQSWKQYFSVLCPNYVVTVTLYNMVLFAFMNPCYCLLMSTQLFMLVYGAINNVKRLN